MFRLSETEYFGINEHGVWCSKAFNKRYLENISFTHHPTEDEVLESHKEYFKDFLKEGVRFRSALLGDECVVPKNPEFSMFGYNFGVIDCGYITCKGKVSEIIPSKLMVDGHEVTPYVSNDGVVIAGYCVNEQYLENIRYLMEHNDLKSIKYATLTFTLEDINKMLEL